MCGRFLSFSSSTLAAGLHGHDTAIPHSIHVVAFPEEGCVTTNVVGMHLRARHSSSLQTDNHAHPSHNAHPSHGCGSLTRNSTHHASRDRQCICTRSQPTRTTSQLSILSQSHHLPPSQRERNTTRPLIINEEVVERERECKDCRTRKNAWSQANTTQNDGDSAGSVEWCKRARQQRCSRTPQSSDAKLPP